MSRKILLVEKNRYFGLRSCNYEKIYSYGREIPEHFLNLQDVNEADKQAVCIVQEVYEEYITENEKDVLNELLGNQQGHLGLQKIILYEIRSMLVSVAFAKKVISEYGIKQQVDLMPKHLNCGLYKILARSTNLIPSQIRIPDWVMAATKRKELIKTNLYKFGLRFYPQLLLPFLLFKRRIGRKIRKSYKYAIYLWGTDGGFSRAMDSMDFFIRENLIKKEDVLYVIDRKVSDSYLSNVEKSGYDYCYFKEMLAACSPIEYLRKCYKRAVEVGRSLAKVKTGKHLILKTYLKVLNAFVLWELFYSKTYVHTFIAIQEPGEVFRVLWQRQHGSKSIFIYTSSSYSVFNAERSYYSRIICDKFISSKIPVEEFKKNGNSFDEYVDIGVIKSDFVHKVKNDNDLKVRLKKELGVPSNKSIISVFDDNADDYDVISIQDVLTFMICVLKLLNSNRNYFFIFKPRTLSIFGRCEELNRVFRQLVSHERCLLVNTAKVKYSACELMGISNLVITVFSSSTLTEAIAGGTKTVCFKPAMGNFVSFGSDIEKLPNLCAHNYEELSQYVDYWLSQANGDSFKEFQNKYVKKLVDSYCDGKALTRLKQYLG